MRLYMLVAIVCGIFTASQVSQAACGSTSQFPDIVGCPIMDTPTTWPECDPDIPVHKIFGSFHYWDEFFAPANQPCQLEFLHMPATVEVMQDLQQCLDLPCTGAPGEPCFHDVLIYPYFVNTQTGAQVIAGQEDCSRRRFQAKGCFVKGTQGRVFVANYIGFALLP